MLPLIFNLGPTELIIILVIVLLLFGGSRLAGLGKSSGRALKEFKEETKGLRSTKDEPGPGTTTPDAAGHQQPQIAPYPPQQSGYGQPQQAPQVQPQDGYGQQNPQSQPYPSTSYPPAPGPVEHPADRDQRRDV